MSRLLILGAGGHGKVVADTAAVTGIWDSISFLDDREELKDVVGLPVIGKLKDFMSFREMFQSAFVAIGNSTVRLEWIQRLIDAGYKVSNIIHPLSVVSKHSSLGEGTFIMAGAVVNAGTSIGSGCIINTSSSIDHDCMIEDGVHISPGAYVSGSVNIGSRTWICVGSSISNNVDIGKNVIVAAGAAVVSDVPDNVMVAGVPAIIKKKIGDE